MLADRLGRCFTGSDGRPCTLQLPRSSLQIFRCKLIVVTLLLSADGRCSVQTAVHQHEDEVGSGSGSREHPNVGAVARHFEQGETKGILLGTEHAADQPFLVLRHPITARVLRDFEMVRSEYGLRRKVGHAGSANTVTPVALTSSLILLA